MTLRSQRMSDPINPLELPYQTPLPNSSGRLHVLIAGVFCIVLAGLEVLYALMMIGMAIFMHVVLSGNIGPSTTLPLPPPIGLFYAIYGGIAALSLAAGIVKLVAG